jgi:two-component system cell cycle sensor histidine kinase/response regulator CckA
MAADARTILVVEDEEPFRRMLVRQLGRLDYHVIEAANAREALEQIAASPRVDALLSDVDMPGLDGPTLAARIREILPNLPAVFMTGFDPPDVVETVLLKPFPLEELAAAIADAIDAGRAAAPVR